MGIVMNYCKNGKCSNCGMCCNDLLPMNDSEIKRIKHFMKRHPVKEQFYRYALDVKNVDLTCPFRDHVNGKCLIYEVRPMICREFLCCNGTEYSERRRDEITADNRHTVFVRAEFFGNREDINWFEKQQKRLFL